MLWRHVCLIAAIAGHVAGAGEATDRFEAARGLHQLRAEQAQDIRRSDLSYRQVASAVTAQSDTPSAATRLVPYIVQGQGWDTLLRIYNTCPEPIHYEVDFYNSDGDSQSFDMGGEDGERYSGFYTAGDQILGMQAHGVLFHDMGEELLRGYGILSDGDKGCVTGNAMYRQKVGEEYREVMHPFQDLVEGWLVPFSNYSREDDMCETAYAVSGDGSPVSFDAYDWSGELLGTVDLGNVHHTTGVRHGFDFSRKGCVRS